MIEDNDIERLSQNETFSTIEIKGCEANFGI